MEKKVAINPVRRTVRVWLLAGVVMVFFQVVIGGVTRLTDSGLSITEWAVIQGTLPPMNEEAWHVAFDRYKEAAKKQFETLHADMTLDEFKFIYFWEYFHRLWARLMGFVFLFPFLFFAWKKWIPSWLMKRLGVVILLASLAAVFGWIMVASGLNNDSRTWVSAYKLIIHLGIATSLFGYLFWTWLKARQPHASDSHLHSLRKLGWILAFVLFIQIVFGGLMAGMRAALIHPYSFIWVEADRFWSAISSSQVTGIDQIVDYEPSQFVKAFVQLLHRTTAWILAALTLFLVVRIRRNQVSSRLKIGSNWLLGILVLQIMLGIFTVINSVGRVPLFFGVVHQAGALILLISVLYVNYQFVKTR